jgi:hypothetical protein
MMSIKIQETIEIRDNGTVLGTVQTQPDGSWIYPTPALAEGAHTFTAHTNGQLSNAWNINIADDSLNLVAPHFRAATSAGPDREEINYYAHAGDGYVEVPDYGMKTGDTVRVSWVGRRVTSNSELQTVGNPAALQPFKISMYEIIDCIGVNAAISYTVVRSPNTVPFQSLSLSLSVFGHSGVVEAPTINSPDNNNLRIQFREDYYSAQVRFIGLTTVESSIREFHGNDLNFPIDAAWSSSNRGRPVLFNWSLKRFGNDNIYYSQVLRVNNL